MCSLREQSVRVSESVIQREECLLYSLGRKRVYAEKEECVSREKSVSSERRVFFREKGVLSYSLRGAECLRNSVIEKSVIV